MILAALLFATMSVCIKFASAHFSTFEMVFYRGLIGAAVMASWCRVQGLSLRTPVLGMHLWRAVVGVTALCTWFYAIAHLPLATAMTLNYMSGVWVAAFLIGGNLAMGRLQDLARQGPLVGTVLVGFAGVVLLLRPTLEQNQLFAGLLGLLSGLCAALAYLQVAALGRVGEPEARTVFYFSVGASISGLLLSALSGFSPLIWPHALWLLPIGVLAALGQLCLTLAYSQGSTLVVANLQYSGIAFAALYGLVLFGDDLPWQGWAGMALIMGSGVAATVLRQRALPSPPADDH